MQRFNELRWAVATRVAALSKYRLYRPIKALLALSVLVGVSWFSYSQGKTSGIVQGVDFYHHMCYDNGGMIIDEAGRVVVCKGLTQMSLDNPKKADTI